MININSNYDPNTNRYTIYDFSSENLKYITLTSSPEHREVLRNILDNRVNTNAQVYGDAHTQASTDEQLNARVAAKQAWFNRGDNEDFHRTFLVEYEGEYIGYVNFGTSANVYVNGQVADEGGALFLPTISNELISEALRAVYVDYTNDLSTRFPEQHPSTEFLYTISQSNSLYNAMEASSSGLDHVIFNDNDAYIRSALLTGVAGGEPRFQINEEDQFIGERNSTGSYREVEVFHHHYESLELLLGEIKGEL
ncbi:hypothetical protein NOVO_08800 [Rickettsiales bacterium Ac37b]|nr:hypothetical protein NOVO_08800 [Rickettsiales bacterium Ac37b]